jgi:hypothetical protein
MVGDGMVWEITTSGEYKDLHDFGGSVTNADGNSGLDGEGPFGAAFDSAGNMYGVTFGGGANQDIFGGDGIVWEITAGGVYKDLHDFGGTAANASGTNGPDGVYPCGVTSDNVGDLFGTTSSGGAYAMGMVWEITASGAYKDLHDFDGTITNANGMTGTDGKSPGAGVTFDDTGNIYGTTSLGGRNIGGILWEITASGAYNDLYDFGAAVTYGAGLGEPGANGPLGASIDNNGTIYGTAIGGGAYGGMNDFGGTVWKLAGAAVVASFPAGMQMFSLPVSYSGLDLDTVFGYSGVTLSLWSPLTDTYETTPSPFASRINLGQSYWANFPQTVTITTQGTPALTTQNFDIRLPQGWNMIGDPFPVSVPIADLLFNNGSETYAQATSGSGSLIASTLWSCPAGSSGYTAATSLDPDQGYWIYAYANTDVEVPHP